MFLKKICIVLLFNYTCLAGVAQNKLIDSLNGFIKTGQPDTLRVKALLELCWSEFSGGDEENALLHASAALELAKQLHYKKGIAAAYTRLGNVYGANDFDKAIENYEKAYALRKELNIATDMARVENNMAAAYENKGDYVKALGYLITALKHAAGDKKLEAYTMISMGKIYSYQGDYDRAIDYQIKGLKINEEAGDKYGAAAAYVNLANTYNHTKDKRSMECYLKALRLMEEVGNKKGIAVLLNNIGREYTNNGDHKKALEYLLRSLKLKEELGDKGGISSTLTNIANEYVYQADYVKAKQYLQQSLELAKSSGSKLLIQNAFKEFSYMYEAMGDHKNSLAYYKLYTLEKDSLVFDEGNKQIAIMNAKFDSEKKDSEIKLLNKDKEKTEALHAEEKQKQRIINLAVGLGLVFAVIFALFVLRSNRQKHRANLDLAAKNKLIEQQKELVERQKELVEEKQKEILDSIYYARRIQRALITNETYIAKKLKALTQYES